MGRVRFRESVKGHLGLGEPEPLPGEALGHMHHWGFELRLKVAIVDFRAFGADPNHMASISGQVRCDTLGGHLPILSGTAQSFAPANQPGRSEIRYHGWFTDSVGKPLTFYGRKVIRRGRKGLRRLWPETTTVYLQVLQSHVPLDVAASALDAAEAEGPPPMGLTVVGAGVPRASIWSFLKLLTTFRGSPLAIIGFCWFFTGQLWTNYRPRPFG